MRTPELQVRIFRDAETGDYVSHCETLDIMMCGESFDSVVLATFDAMAAHFVACRKDGSLPGLLASLGVPPDLLRADA